MRKKLLLKKEMTFSLMCVLAVSPVLVAHANPGAVFSSKISGGTKDTPDTPDKPDVPDTPDVPDVPNGSGSSSGGGSGSGSTVTTNSSSTSSALDSVMVSGVKVFTTVAGRYSANSVAGVIVTTPYSDVAAAVGAGANQKPFAVIENSVCGEDSKACMMKKLEEMKAISPEVVSGPALDIWIGTSDANNNFTKVVKAARPIEFKIGIPANFKTDGYEYALIFVQSDGTTSVIVDTDDDSDTMTFSTDVYGTFTLVKGPSGSFAAYR